jgi:AmmeMemoRadiSam system protein B
VFLQHVLASADFRIVPILCGFMEPHLSQCSRFSDIPSVGPFLDCLRDAAAAEGTLVVAGVDLAHVGLKFGDKLPASALMSAAEAHDKALIDALCRMDAEAFWSTLAGVEDRYHVCGASALACLLEILPAGTGTLLQDDMWHEETTRSAVGFASVLFATA